MKETKSLFSIDRIIALLAVASVFLMIIYFAHKVDQEDVKARSENNQKQIENFSVSIDSSSRA